MSTPTPEQRLEQEKELQLATFLFSLIEAQITRADTKAGLVVAADTVFVTAILLSSRGVILHLLDPSASLVARAAAVLSLLTFVNLICSTLFALTAARPALKVRDDEGTLFFFGRIAQMDHPEYLDSFSAQNPTALRHAILTEVHNTSLIAMRKFARVRHSLDFLIAATVLYALLQVLTGLLP